MTIHAPALSFAVDVALGSWLGAMAFFSFVGAPRAFAVFDDAAGEYVTDVFPRYYRLGVALGVVAVVAALVRGALTSFDGPTLSVIAAAAIATLLAGYSVRILIPKMRVAGDDAFDRYHRQSVVLNGLTMLAVLVALIGNHLPR